MLFSGRNSVKTMRPCFSGALRTAVSVFHSAPPLSASAPTVVRSLVPSVRHLRRIFDTDCSKVALKAGAQAYLNFMCVSSTQGWKQAYRRRMLRERMERDEQRWRGSLQACGDGKDFVGSAFNAVSTVGRVERDTEYHKGADAEFLRASAARYLYFTKLRSTCGETLEAWIPPRDVSVFWHAELLRPTKTLGSKPRDVPRRGADELTWFHSEQIRLLRDGALFEKTTSETSAPDYGRFLVPSTLFSGVFLSTFTGFFPAVAAGIASSVVLGHHFPKVTRERALKTTPGIKAFDRDDSGSVTQGERAAALKQWMDRQRATRRRWEAETGTPYASPPHSKYAQNHVKDLFDPSRVARVLEMDEGEMRRRVGKLVAAVQSQSSLVSRMLSLGPGVVNDAYIERAVDRYCEFLALAKKNPNQMLVPTLDIDLIWHVHMLSQLDYHDDCHALLGRLLNHDAELSEEKIASAFSDTQKLYAAAFGGAYVWSQSRSSKTNNDDETSNRKNAGDGGGGSGRGSCGGWGGHHLVHGSPTTIGHGSDVDSSPTTLQEAPVAAEFGSSSNGDDGDFTGGDTLSSFAFSDDGFGEAGGSAGGQDSTGDAWFADVGGSDGGDGGSSDGGGCGGCGGCGG